MDQKKINCSYLIKKNRLDVLDILKQALTLSLSNINFIVLAFLTSTPLLLFSVYFETHLQTTLIQGIQLLTPNQDYSYNLNYATTNSFTHNLIQLCLMYLVPFNFLHTCSVLVIVDIASKIHKGDRNISLKDFACKRVYKTKLIHTVITSMYVVLLSSCTLLPMSWSALYPYIMAKNNRHNLFFTSVYGMIFVAMISKHLEWSVVWNMGLLVSIMEEEEEVYGAEAFVLSGTFCRAGKRQGSVLMLVFFAWELYLRFPCLYAGGCCEGGTGVWVQVGLFCVGNVIKWVACLVYFCDCKRQVMERRMDVETGFLDSCFEVNNSDLIN